MANAREHAPGRDTEFGDWLAAREPALARSAYLIAGNHADAADLVQTALTKLYLAWDRVDKANVDAYVRRIIVNEHASSWRRAWRRRETSRAEMPERAAATEPTEERTAMWEFLATLPARQRAVLVLRYYEDLTEAETAEVLGISIGTVKSQTSKAMASLRRRFESGEVAL